MGWFCYNICLFLFLLGIFSTSNPFSTLPIGSTTFHDIMRGYSLIWSELILWIFNIIGWNRWLNGWVNNRCKYSWPLSGPSLTFRKIGCLETYTNLYIALRWKWILFRHMLEDFSVWQPWKIGKSMVNLKEIIFFS